MRQKQLERLCRTWQDRLRLNDWKVEVNLVDASDLSMTDSSGEVYYNVFQKQAVINICTEETWPQISLISPDIEHTLVHELLHLHTSLIIHANDGEQTIAEEQAVNLIADALVAAYRKEG